MPSYIGKATDAFFDAINTGSSIVKDYTENEARFATTTKKYNLQADINNEMQKIAMNGNYTTWQTDINNFFEKVKGQMSDPNSQYYCKNNLQAKMFDEVLNDSLVSVGNRVSMMVMQKQLSQMGVDRDQAINRLIEQGITGKDFVQKANEIDDAFWLVNGNVNPDEKQATRESRVLYGYESERKSYFNKFKMDAIRNGDSFETLWDMTKTNASVISATNENGTPMAIDFNGIDTKLEKELKSEFLAAQKDYQKENANELSMIYQELNQATDEEQKVNIAKKGQNKMSLMKEWDLSEDDRNKYSQYFRLSDPSITNSQAKAAINKLEPKDAMNFFLNSIKRGDESDLGGPSTVYNSYELFKGRCMDELLKINPEYTYTELEQSCPTVMEYLEYAKKSLPPMMQDVVTSAENMLKACLGNEDYEEEMNSVMDLTYDMLFEAHISDFDAAQQKEYRDRIARAINGKYGSILQKNKKYKWLKEENGISAITDYKQGVIGQEKALAKAMQVRDNNPDIYYQDMYGNKKFWMGEDVQNGLTLIEKEERQMVADAIKYKTGKEINPDKIPSVYESDGINDVNVRNVYTVDGHDYYFTSKDGQHVTMYVKKTGETEWKETMTKSQNEKYDSPDELVNRTAKEKNLYNAKIPEGGFTYTDENGKTQKLTYTDPDGEEKTITQSYWKYITIPEKKRIMKDFLQKNPEAFNEWLKTLPFK